MVTRIKLSARRIVAAALAVLVAGSGAASSSGYTFAMMRVESVSRPPIVLVRRTPDVGERLAPGAAIELVFDRAMNPASAEGLSFVPALRGTTSWPDARTLRFDPVEPLPRDTAFVVGLDDRVRAADGGVLAEPLNLRFRT
jgi:hypothetical protein